MFRWHSHNQDLSREVDLSIESPESMFASNNALNPASTLYCEGTIVAPTAFARSNLRSQFYCFRWHRDCPRRQWIVEMCMLACSNALIGFRHTEPRDRKQSYIQVLFLLLLNPAILIRPLHLRPIRPQFHANTLATLISLDPHLIISDGAVG